MSIPSHERAIFLVLPEGVTAARAFALALRHAEVRAFALPAPWELAWGPVDVLRDVPSIATIDLDAFEPLFAYFARAGTPAALETLVERTWVEIPERVRQYWLGRGALSILAGVFRLGPRSGEVAPPAGFREDRRVVARFEATYRLHAVAGSRSDPVAPAEEGSLVVYPFDVRNLGSRAEAGLPPEGRETIVEVFAYEAGRERHRRWLESVAASLGARVLDPAGR